MSAIADRFAPVRVMARLLLWVAAVELGSALLLMLGGAIGNALGYGSAPLVYLFPLVATGLYVLVIRREAYSAGQGDRRAGLGLGTIRWRPVLLGVPGVAACYGLVLLATTHVTWLRDGISSQVLKTMSPDAFGGTPGLVLISLYVGLVAPVTEEMMYRGWAWTEIRRHWGAWSTASATGLIFAICHIAEGPAKVLLLIPITILFSVVREMSGGIGGTIALHLLNNIPALYGAYALMKEPPVP